MAFIENLNGMEPKSSAEPEVRDKGLGCGIDFCSYLGNQRQIIPLSYHMGMWYDSGMIAVSQSPIVTEDISNGI